MSNKPNFSLYLFYPSGESGSRGRTFDINQIQDQLKLNWLELLNNTSQDRLDPVFIHHRSTKITLKSEFRKRTKKTENISNTGRSLDDNWFLKCMIRPIFFIFETESERHLDIEEP